MHRSTREGVVVPSPSVAIVADLERVRTTLAHVLERPSGLRGAAETKVLAVLTSHSLLSIQAGVCTLRIRRRPRQRLKLAPDHRMQGHQGKDKNKRAFTLCSGEETPALSWRWAYTCVVLSVDVVLFNWPSIGSDKQKERNSGRRKTKGSLHENLKKRK